MIHIFHKKKHCLQYKSDDGDHDFALKECKECGKLFVKGKIGKKSVNRKASDDDIDIILNTIQCIPNDANPMLLSINADMVNRLKSYKIS